jgi:hypothetical protein
MAEFILNIACMAMFIKKGKDDAGWLPAIWTLNATRSRKKEGSSRNEENL